MSDGMLLHTTKFDGSLHYRFPVVPIVNTETFFAGYTAIGEPIQSHRFDHEPAKYPSLGLCWNDRPYNVWVTWYDDWRPRHCYVNIATPATWADGTLRYIDLDLDLILRANGEPPILDDADEFDAHREKWAYPPELVETCLRTSVEVAMMMRRRVWPFDRSPYAWRPGKALQLP